MPKKSETIARSKSKEFKADETAIEEEVAANAQVPEQQPRRSARNAKETTSTVSEKEREKSTGTKKTVKNPKKGSKAKGAKEEDEEEDSAIEEETKKEEEGEPQVGKKIKTNDEKGVEVIEKKTIVEEVKTVIEEDGVKKTKVQQTLTEKTTVEKLLPREFYTRDVVTLSRELLGKIIVRRIGDQVIRARIVEAEAYAGAIDKACHAYQNKKTPKTKPMFREGGHVYVYSIYGNNNCLNITASKEGDPSATLIRAVEIVDGFDLAVANRDAKKLSKTGKELTNGPGKMCAAMKIDKSFNEVDVTQKGDLYIIDDTKSFEVLTTKRININYAEEYVHKPWRFCIKDHHCISVKADPCKPEPL